MATDHFIAHPRSRECTDWNFNILFNDQPKVGTYVKQYKSALKHPGLYETVPGEWLHATVLRVGLLEDFSEKEMLETAERLEQKLANLSLPQLLLGQWFIWDGNPCLHITPDTQLQEVLRLIVEALNETVGKNRAPQKQSFTPHVTLAYSKAYDDELGLYKQLEGQHIKSLKIRANSVSLIKQHVENDYYVWDIVKTLALGQAA
jgi:2'-5' RNA ligase